VLQRDAISLDGPVAVVTGGAYRGTAAAGGWYHRPDGHYLLGPH
jgi:hypothetical protein